MIQRRRPIESAIAERKMFNMGGMAVSMPQPTYMDLMQQGIMGMPQQPMGMPQQPQGIMASSQPLVDAIAADANNPAGGDTLSMAQGGAVGFDQGGISIGQAPQAIQIPTLTPTLTQQGGSAVFDPANPITMSPKSIMDEAPSERVQRIFPDAAANVGKLTFDREFPEFKRDEEAGRPKSYFTEGAARVLQGGRAAIRDFVSEVGQDISAISNVLFGGDTRSLVEGASSQEGLDRVTSEIGIARAVAEMIQRRPDAENQIMSLSKRIINNAKTDGTELDGQKIAEAVAYGLTTGEREQAIGYDMAQRDAERGDVDAGRSTDQGEFGGTPTAIEKPVPILQDDPNLGQEIVPAEGTPTAAAADVIEIPPTPTRPGFEPDDDSDVPRQGPFDVEGEIDPDAGLLVKTEAPASDAAAQVAEAFDKPMTKPEATKTIQDYKNKFLEAMPEYEGVSEEEKGYRFIEAGLRVMAGQSPNAIENIATGLKGLGAEFAKDEKEKRAYDRQVDLSAAKYALEGVAKEDAKAEALAKEGRGLKTVFWTEDVIGPDGKLRGKSGTSGFITNQEIHSGQYDGKFEAGLALATERLKNQTKGNVDLLRNMIGQTKKGGMSDEFFDKRLKEYTASSLKLSDYATQLALVDVSAVINEQGEATGLGSYASRRVNEFYNAFNVGRPSDDKQIESIKDLTSKDIDKLEVSDSRKDRLRAIQSGYSQLDKLSSSGPINFFDSAAAKGRRSEQFFAQQQELANLLIKEILGEGSKNVSNIDRQLASEIVGLYSGLSSVTADSAIIGQRLGRIRQRILKNYESENNAMSATEAFFTNTIDRNQRNVRETYFTPVRRSALGQIESALGRPRTDRPAAGSPYTFKTINGKRTYSFK